MWKLVIEDDESKRTVVPLTRDDYTIGRQEGNTIRLTERNVSRDHGRIFRRRTSGPNGGTREVFLVEDRKSYNGIFVNGLRVAQAQDLQNGDLIQIGDYRLVLQDDTANQTAEITAITVTTTDFDAKTTIPLSAPTPYRAVTLTDRPNRFVMLVGPSPGVEFPLDRERMTIGRAEDATISVNHNSVSRLHCEVHALGDGRYEIVDKGSSNGVRVNAVELRRSIIEAGDFIELGDVRFKFVGAGQVFVPGPHESQQLTAISDREADLVDPTQRSWGGYAIPIVGAGILGAGLILAFVYVLRTRAVADTPPNTTLTSGDDEQALVAGAKRTCKIDDCDAAHDQIGKLGAASPWRKSIDFQQVESMWADSMLRKAQSEVDPTAKRAILQRVATAATVDAPRRKQASDLIAGLDQQTTASAQPTVTQEPTIAPVVLPSIHTT